MASVLCFWRHLTVKRLLHLDFFLVQQPLRKLKRKGERTSPLRLLKTSPLNSTGVFICFQKRYANITLVL